ncbi:MAG: hypothetical protein JWN41_795, partial [Thermoleophilia bacterium]|nr:hypothetical protein [Thermoleophilia bacterium]
MWFAPDISSPLIAHGLAISVRDLPLPIGAFYVGATAALALSFAVLTARLRAPADSESDLRRAPRAFVRFVEWPAWRWLASLLGVAWLVATVTVGMFGSTESAENAAPNLVFVLGWIGLPLAALVLGRGALRLHPVAALARIGGLRNETDNPVPRRLGVWVAWLGLLVFTWLELVYPTATHVRVLGVLVLAWAVTGIWAAARWGIQAWLEHVDPFGTYVRVLASLSPWGERADGTIGRRVPLTGPNRDLAPEPGLVAFATLLIGSVSFDGLTRTGWWQSQASRAVPRLVDQGLSTFSAGVVFGTLGFMVLVALVWALFELAAYAAGRVGRLRVGHGLDRSAQWFAPSLMPIALAYVVAHYFSFFVVQVQDLTRYASDPMGRGADYFGTARNTLLDLHVPDGTLVWLVQVGAIVIGHVAGLLVAHNRALELAPLRENGRVNVARVTASQLPMLVLMLLYTVG